MYSGIFSKIDWYTCMFQNCSIFDVIDIFGIEFDIDIADLFARHYTSSKGYSSDISFDFNGINIRTDIRDIYNAFHTDDVDEIGADEFFNARINSIRLDISGKGLDYIRSMAIVPEDFFRAPFQLKEGQGYHVTRCDFAFDFLDTHQNFLSDLSELCKELDTGNGVMIGAGKTPPTKYEIHKGSQQFTLYLGGNRSNKRLRVYDKAMQFNNSHKLISEHPYYDSFDDTIPASWIRIELQTRNDISRNLLYNSTDESQTLRYIYDNFQMKAKGSSVVSEVWLNLWDWETIPSIIQNEKSIEFVDYTPAVERAEKFITGQALINILTYINAYGFESLEDKVLDELQRLQTGNAPSDHFRMRSLLMRMSDLKYSNPELLPHLYNHNGVLKYKKFIQKGDKL